MRGSGEGERGRGASKCGGAQTHNLGGPWPRPTTTNQREDTSRKKKEAKMERERQKKSEILGGPGRGGVTGDHLFVIS